MSELSSPQNGTPQCSLPANPGVQNAYPSRFEALLAQHDLTLRRAPARVLQVNLGKLCNQSCRHCHVEAGPRRTEIMSLDIVQRLIECTAESRMIRTVDLTGGAPEMNPHFRHMVRAMRGLGREVIARSNLTILVVRGYTWIPEFFAEQRVHVISSLPCYTAERVERQRGRGVFDRSIRALRLLNEQGYGRDPNLLLDLVYNPFGEDLPPAQDELEAEYKRILGKRFGIVFNQLYTLTNLPIGRFARDLRRQKRYEPYLERLEQSFNPHTVPQLMCRETLNVGWDGRLYDCDFNQMLGLELDCGAPALMEASFSLDALHGREIVRGDHCLGCTAGAGSSCGGALI